MRDIILLAIVIGLLPFILRSPRLGAHAWAWLSLMNPHRLTYGIAFQAPLAYSVALATLLGFLFAGKERKPFPLTPISVVYLLFVFWLSFTCLFALNDSDIVLDRWIAVMKIHIMLVLTLMLIRGRKDLEILIWIVTFSVGFYGIKGGIWIVLTGGAHRVWGPAGSMIADNNGLALALVMIAPFVYYLYQVTSRPLFRFLLLCSGVAICFSILGSFSRGAFLALLAMSFLLALKGKQPLLSSLLLGSVLLLAVLFMPETWSTRMDSIKNYVEDASAMSRLYTWQTMWNLALDRPLVGGGLSTDSAAIFAMYAPVEYLATFSKTVFVAHSIYFQALGSHGFPGLFLYLALGFLAWRKAGKLAKTTAEDPEYGDWVPLLMRMTQVSLIGFAVGGAFLSLVNFDLPYYLVVFVMVVDATIRERAAAPQASLPESP